MFSVCFVTTPNMTVAKELSRLLVQQHRAAACVNIIPGITSVYEWDGKLCEDSEILLMIKTATDRVAQVTEVVKANHPYDCPEVIALPMQEGMGNPAYLDWVRAQTRPK